jgi:hypothetical protein
MPEVGFIAELLSNLKGKVFARFGWGKAACACRDFFKNIDHKFSLTVNDLGVLAGRVDLALPAVDQLRKNIVRMGFENAAKFPGHLEGRLNATPLIVGNQAAVFDSGSKRKLFLRHPSLLAKKTETVGILLLEHADLLFYLIFVSLDFYCSNWKKFSEDVKR